MAPKLLALFLALLGHALAGATQAAMPPALAAAAQRTGMTDADINLAQREPVSIVYGKESQGRQVTVLGLVRVPVSPEKLAADLDDRDAGLRTTTLRDLGVFSEEPKLSDLADFRMPESDLETLADCQIGSCRFKLPKPGIARVQQIDWSQPGAYDEANDMMKAALLQIAAGYATQGGEALPITADKAEPLSFREGADRLAAQLGFARELVPELYDHLKDYPRASIPGARDRILWTVRDYGYRPVTSLIHAVTFEREDGPAATLVALKTLYANHYFHARERVYGLFADDEDPNLTWVGYSDRLIFDDDIGSIKRRMLQAGIARSARQTLSELRASHQ